MQIRLSSVVLGALVSLAACQGAPSGGAFDLASAPPDLATIIMPKKVTIRDLTPARWRWARGCMLAASSSDR